MNRILVALALAASGSTIAAAQGPHETELVLTAFLEKRVPDELAAEGLVLSRNNLTIQIEMVGDKMLVSLVDLTTSKVAASTKLDVVPADREAAVAAVTHVAADLVMQIVRQHEAAPPQPVADDRAERLQHEKADLLFQRQAIRFGATYDLSVNHGTGTLSRRWVTFQGDLDQDLPPEDFYRALGRPDLAKEYAHRHDLAVGGMVAFGIATVVTGVLFVKSAMADEQTCTPGDFATFTACVQGNEKAHDDARSTYLPAAGIGVGVMFATFLYGAWYAYHLHPITESEAKTLAEQYNQNLRHNLGLPVVKREILHDVKIAPYFTGGDGGIALGGRF